MHILVFGDSEAYGAYDKEGGWVARLRKYVDKKSSLGKNYYCLVYNMSISGDTSKGVLERFDAETARRLDDEKDDRFIISIGANDSMFMHEKNDNLVALSEFKENIQKLINKTRKYSKKIVFIGLLPVDEKKVDPIPWSVVISEDGVSYKGSYRNVQIKKFNAALRELCGKNSVLFVDNYEKWVKSDYKALLLDGVHPNTKGHEKIYTSVKEFLEKEGML